ncbi:MAG: flavodoxin family protein [Candidatus Atribacteria bacterium]|nr:flavodoxin family protein [Candidatus Atribacteria bacterium]
MKVIAINGSPRAEGNTAQLIRYVLEEIEKAGIETEMIQLAGKTIRGCIACYRCFDHRNQRCSIQNDAANLCIQKMIEADGIILGTPTYFADITAEMKGLIDRAGMVAGANDQMFQRKVGAAVVAVRRAGAIHALDSINHFFLAREMIIPGSSYWNIGFGRDIGEVTSDEEGIQTMRVLGQNLAWLLKKIHG